MSLNFAFNELPQPIQMKIHSLLANQNFLAAKELYDHFRYQEKSIRFQEYSVSSLK
jgi:hypothetical protein